LHLTRKTTDKINGYVELSPETIALVNIMKELEQEVVGLVDEITNADQRWLAIGKTDIQKGFMAVVRGITRPR